MKLWEPRKDVFPKGMPSIQQQLQTPIITHNKYYSPDNQYQTEFDFLVEQHAAMPLTQDFWNYIMAQGIHFNTDR